eukprot:496936-Prymnesium_polylepis.1
MAGAACGIAIAHARDGQAPRARPPVSASCAFQVTCTNTFQNSSAMDRGANPRSKSEELLEVRVAVHPLRPLNVLKPSQKVAHIDIILGAPTALCGRAQLRR